jgi:cell division GTPase FtsZ
MDADDPALDRIAATVAAITRLVTSPPNLVGFDFADLRAGLIKSAPAQAGGGPAVFGQGEASGPDRATRGR